uniref:Uncharacterized protein n=1 Tax=Sphaerodactylus townsendi TaxID=933632 RepID=A0ACB8G0D1_9SAUR
MCSTNTAPVQPHSLQGTLARINWLLWVSQASRQASGIPGLTPTDEKDGNLPDIIASGSLHEFLVHLHEKYGPVASYWFGRHLVISLGSIDVLRQHINPNRTCESGLKLFPETFLEPAAALPWTLMVWWNQTFLWFIRLRFGRREKTGYDQRNF